MTDRVWRKLLPACIIVAAMASIEAAAATLTGGEGSGLPGQNGVTIAVTLASSSGESVAALQFEAVFDATAVSLTGVAAGTAATEADKQVVYNQLETGRVRVIVSGFNQNIIGDGSVAESSFSIRPAASEGVYPIALEQLVLSDPTGRRISGTAAAGEITVGKLQAHSADIDLNWRISLGELLRVIQFFNSKAYHCDKSSEDGYAPTAGNQDCPFHDSDYYPSANWVIELSEVLRLIQFFNIGQYHVDTTGEDGFAPGPMPVKAVLPKGITP